MKYICGFFVAISFFGSVYILWQFATNWKFHREQYQEFMLEQMPGDWIPYGFYNLKLFLIWMACVLMAIASLFLFICKS